MSQLSYILSGAAPVIKKLQIAATQATAGVPVLIPAAAGAGTVLATTTGAAKMIGCTLDTATYSTTQGSGSSSAVAMTSVVINPDAVWKALMSGGAANNTVLAQKTVTTASSGGTAITTGDSWTSGVEYADGHVWGYTGANAAGSYLPSMAGMRKITSTSATAGTVTVPFDYATVVGDIFLRCPYTPFQTTTMQLTTTLDQVNAIISVGTGAALKCVELILRDKSDNGISNSFALFVSNDHALQLA